VGEWLSIKEQLMQGFLQHLLQIINAHEESSQKEQQQYGF
jgi:hypothetical protein